MRSPIGAGTRVAVVPPAPTLGRLLEEAGRRRAKPEPSNLAEVRSLLVGAVDRSRSSSGSNTSRSSGAMLKSPSDEPRVRGGSAASQARSASGQRIL